MRELFGTAVNFALVKQGDALEAVAEVILVLSEPTYAVDATGSMLRRRDLSQERFSVSIEMLRKHVAQLQIYIAEGDELAASVALNPKE